jgi:hypothetical protein
MSNTKPNVCNLIFTTKQNKRLVRDFKCIGLSYTDPKYQMRRKAETLKHDQGENKLTKKQEWALHARGKLQKKKSYASQTLVDTNPNSHNLTQVGNTLVVPCPSNGATKAYPPSASDVPFYGEKLRMNKDVPLVDYKKKYVYAEANGKYITFEP